jgi:hypothetical protein
VNPAGPNGTDLGNATLYAFGGSLANGPLGAPLQMTVDRWNWTSEGNENATRLRLVPDVSHIDNSSAPFNSTSLTMGDYFVSVIYPGGSTALAVPGELLLRGAGVPAPLDVALLQGASAGTVNLRIVLPDGTIDVLTLSGPVLNAAMEPDGTGAGDPVITLQRDHGVPTTLLAAGCLDVNRSQGSVGLTVLDVGYTFGEAPAWVRNARAQGTAAQPPYLWPLNPALSAKQL